MKKTSPMKKLAAGDTVRWTSQAAGSPTTKEGKIVRVVPAGAYPEMARLSQELYARSNYGGGGPRNQDSYVVLVPGGKTAKAKPVLYWPNPAALKLVQAAAWSSGRHSP